MVIFAVDVASRSILPLQCIYLFISVFFFVRSFLCSVRMLHYFKFTVLSILQRVIVFRDKQSLEQFLFMSNKINDIRYMEYSMLWHKVALWEAVQRTINLDPFFHSYVYLGTVIVSLLLLFLFYFTVLYLVFVFIHFDPSNHHCHSTFRDYSYETVSILSFSHKHTRLNSHTSK